MIKLINFVFSLYSCAPVGPAIKTGRILTLNSNEENSIGKKKTRKMKLN